MSIGALVNLIERGDDPMYWIIKRIRNSKFTFITMFSGFFISMIALSIGTSTIAKINKITDDRSNGNFKYVKNISLLFKDDYKIDELITILKENFINSDVAIECIPIETQNHEIMIVSGILPKDKYLWSPPIEKGKFLNGSSNGRVVVVGNKITNGVEDNKLNIGRNEYEIIGISGRKEESPLNREVFVPINYMTEILGAMSRKNYFEFVVKNNKNPQVEIDSFKNKLLNKYSAASINVTDDGRIARERGFIVRMFQENLKDLLKIWLIAIFNIINLSYFWIHSRRKEIALRKVVGSSKASLYIFLLKEIVFVCFIASIAAVLFLVVLNKLSIQLFAYEFNLSFGIAMLSISISLLTCVFTSIIPTRIALKIQPVAVLKE